MNALSVADTRIARSTTPDELMHLPGQVRVLSPQFAWAQVRGVRLGALFDELAPAAAFVTVYASDGYATSLSRQSAQDALLVYEIDGAPLSHRSGGPVRLLLASGPPCTSLKRVVAIAFGPDAEPDRLPVCHHHASGT